MLEENKKSPAIKPNICKHPQLSCGSPQRKQEYRNRLRLMRQWRATSRLRKRYELIQLNWATLIGVWEYA
jgi:hypothetical protein